jgi:hypothetical protein
MMEVEVVEIPTKPVSKQSHKLVPYCEKLLEKMFYATLIPAVTSRYKILRYGVPILVNLILGSAAFSPLFYPEYYATQTEVWTTDIVIAWISYNYMIYLFKRWDIAKCYEEIDVSKFINRISLLFYWLYLIYWFYFAVIQFNTHNEKSILIQLGNALMSSAWYIFFSTMVVLYYFVCIKLSQRSTHINQWLKEVKDTRPVIDIFYADYNRHYKSVKELAKYWNVLIFVGTILLTFHVPIDLISIIYNHYYFDIFGLIVKLFSLLWYLWCICELNEYESYVISYLHKHRIYTFLEIETLEKYILYRPLGLNFYGIKINKSIIIKVGLLLLNLVIPTFYALISNKILK